ncbi:hypothetical protein B0H14DRAFT_3134281 [Mycena olivaceomarginata]|nr:hypothetical protein B0H14DRAFT_3134281 [Mycena olivaceomarginata]
MFPTPRTKVQPSVGWEAQVAWGYNQLSHKQEDEGSHALRPNIGDYVPQDECVRAPAPRRFSEKSNEVDSQLSEKRDRISEMGDRRCGEDRENKRAEETREGRDKMKAHHATCRASVPVLHDNGEHPHLIDIDQTCSTLRSNAIKNLLVVGDDGHKITRKFAEKFHVHAGQVGSEKPAIKGRNRKKPNLSMNFGPFPVYSAGSSSDAGRAAKRGRRGPVHRETRPSSSPSSSPFQSHVACSSHLPIRLRTLWLPYAPGDLARPPPRPATAPQLWQPTSAAAGAGAASLPLRPYPQARAPARKVRGPDPATSARERSLCSAGRVRVPHTHRAPARGTARRAGDACTPARAPALPCWLLVVNPSLPVARGTQAPMHMGWRRTARTHDPPAVPRAAPARCDGDGESAETRAARRAQRHVRRRRGVRRVRRAHARCVRGVGWRRRQVGVRRRATAAAGGAYGVSRGYGDVRAGENGDWGGGECRACTGLNGGPRLGKADVALSSGENGEVGVNLSS